MKNLLKFVLLSCLSLSSLAYADETFSVENQLNSTITLQTDPTSATALSFDTLEVPASTTLDNVAHYELDSQGHAQVRFSIAITSNDVIYVEKNYTRKGRTLSCSTSSNYHRSGSGHIHIPHITNALCSGNPKITVGP